MESGPVLVLSFSDLGRDPRVNRQIRFLARRHRVLAAGFGDPCISGVPFIRVAWPGAEDAGARSPLARLGWTAGRARNVPRRVMRLLRLGGARVMPAARRSRSYEGVYWSSTLIQDCLLKLRSVDASLIIANDLDTLPLALRLARGRPVLFDAHEYAPREYDNSASFRLLQEPYRRYLCTQYIPAASGMITVCDGIADTYFRDTGVRPAVLTNAPDYEDLAPSPMLPDGRVRLVHHGMGSPVRKIENMIHLMDHLDERFELELMLMPSPGSYVNWLRRLAAPNPRIRFAPTVPMRELPRATNGHDLGLFLLEPTNFNYLHALPNKFFEFVQARLGIAVGPSPEMAALVQRHGLGVVAPSFEPRALAAELNRLSSADITRFKDSSHRAARELSADRNADLLESLAAPLLARR